VATRNQLEQRALDHIQRGQLDKAVRCYLEILRTEQHDRRIMKKVGELYLRQGRQPEGLRYMTDAADQASRDGQNREAVSIYKQLIELRPGDSGLVGLLGDSYRRAGLVADAGRLYEKVIGEHTAEREYGLAIDYMRRLLDLRPNDMSLRFRLADLLRSDGQNPEALAIYREIAGILTRRGESSELARVAEAILELSPENEEHRLVAAEARLAQGDWSRALELVRSLEEKQPDDVRVLEIVATASAKSGELAQARSALLALAGAHRKAGNTPAEARALRRAVEAGEDSAEVKAALGAADLDVGRFEARLDDKAVMAPTDPDETVCCARAGTYLRYGFPEKAESALREGLSDRPRSLPLVSRLVEVLVAQDRAVEAKEILVDAHAWASPSMRALLADRLVSLGGPRMAARTETESGAVSPEPQVLVQVETADEENPEPIDDSSLEFIEDEVPEQIEDDASTDEVDVTSPMLRADKAGPSDLFEMAAIQEALGRLHSAIRLLEEIRKGHPAFRPADVRKQIERLRRTLATNGPDGS
jgi:tetratricopeptide (TPR) repeat protein